MRSWSPIQTSPRLRRHTCTPLLNSPRHIDLRNSHIRLGTIKSMPTLYGSLISHISEQRKKKSHRQRAGENSNIDIRSSRRPVGRDKTPGLRLMRPWPCRGWERITEACRQAIYTEFPQRAPENYPCAQNCCVPSQRIHLPAPSCPLSITPEIFPPEASVTSWQHART